jgi:hypothetical protein
MGVMSERSERIIDTARTGPRVRPQRSEDARE